MIKKKSGIRFHFLSSGNLKDRIALKAFIRSIIKRENQTLRELNIVFCDDVYLLHLNRQFLKHDFYTDILSFPFSSRGEPIEAEIYISLERVRENAKNLGDSFRSELHRIIFHGILHLCGYHDKTATDIKKMRSIEDSYLKDYFSQRPKTRV